MNYYALGQVTVTAMSLKNAIQHYNNSLEYKTLKNIYGEYITSTEDKHKILLEESIAQQVTPGALNISLDAWQQSYQTYVAQHLQAGQISFDTHNEEDQHDEPYEEPHDSDHPQSNGK